MWANRFGQAGAGYRGKVDQWLTGGAWFAAGLFWYFRLNAGYRSETTVVSSSVPRGVQNMIEATERAAVSEVSLGTGDPPGNDRCRRRLADTIHAAITFVSVV
jgi:hypothetical protein